MAVAIECCRTLPVQEHPTSKLGICTVRSFTREEVGDGETAGRLAAPVGFYGQLPNLHDSEAGPELGSRPTELQSLPGPSVFFSSNTVIDGIITWDGGAVADRTAQDFRPSYYTVLPANVR